MKNILKLGILAFTFALILVGTGSVNAQGRSRDNKSRQEVRNDSGDKRRDYSRRINQGNNRRVERDWRNDRRNDRKRMGRAYKSRWYNGRGQYNGRGYYNRGYQRSGRAATRRW